MRGNARVSGLTALDGLTVIILPPPSTGFRNPRPSTTSTCVTAPSTVAPSVSLGSGGRDERVRDPMSLWSVMIEVLAGTSEGTDGVECVWPIGESCKELERLTSEVQ